MRKQLFTILLQIGYKTVGMPRGNWMIVRVPIYRASRDVYGETKDGGKWKILFCSVGEDSGYKKSPPQWICWKAYLAFIGPKAPRGGYQESLFIDFLFYLPTYLSTALPLQILWKPILCKIDCNWTKERKHNIIRGKIVFVPLYVSASARSYLGNISVERGTQVRTLNARFE